MSIEGQVGRVQIVQDMLWSLGVCLRNTSTRAIDGRFLIIRSSLKQPGPGDSSELKIPTGSECLLPASVSSPSWEPRPVPDRGAAVHGHLFMVIDVFTPQGPLLRVSKRGGKVGF
jgi:hypothetical protein